MRDAIPVNQNRRRLWKTLDEGLENFGFSPVCDLFPIEMNGSQGINSERVAERTIHPVAVAVWGRSTF